jgi:small subunit ribosomal protein S6
MALYEIVYIARQEISENDVEKITEEFSKLIEKDGGKVLKTEYWGLRSFSYEIKKAKKGHYTLLGVEAPAEAIKELERNMRLHENVVRNLTVRVSKISREPSSIMQNNADDDFELKIDTNQAY